MSKAILIIIDGCRPDGLMEAETPNIDGIIERGCHSFSAASVDPPTTLPVHIGIFTSRKPVNHGVLTNAGVPDYSAGAWSIIDLVKYNGKSTAAFFSWEHFANLALPGAFDFFVHSHTEARDELHDLVLAEHAARHLTDKTPDFTFVYLEGTDKMGHKFGYMSREYLTAIETADRAIGHIVDQLQAADLLDQYTIVIQRDHGGIDYQHTQVIPDVRTVPWIAAGPDIIGSHTIAADVSVLDTAPTLARIIGIPLHPSWEGKVIDEIFK